jgi:hypothetical protein
MPVILTAGTAVLLMGETPMLRNALRRRYKQQKRVHDTHPTDFFNGIECI